MSIRRGLLSALVAAVVLTPAGWLVAQDEPVDDDPAASEVDILAGDDLDVSGIEQILRGDQEVMQGEMFSYDPAGRRDPFRSLRDAMQGPESESAAQRPPGLEGTLVEELRVQGIIQTPTGILAFAQSTRDNYSYIIRPGTKLYNGEVKEILPKKVIFRQQVSDPKQLRPYEEVVRELVD